MQEKKDQLSSARRMIIPQEPAVKLPEESYTGIGASKGIAIGECYVFIKEIGSHEPRELNEKNINEEIQRFRTALERSEKELKKIERVTIRKLGKGYSDLFQAQIMMLYGAKMGEVDVHHHARKFGTSKYGIGRTIKVMSDLLFMVFFQQHCQCRV